MSMPKALAISIDSLWEGLTRLIQVPDSSASISLNSVVVDKKDLLHDLFPFQSVFCIPYYYTTNSGFWDKSLQKNLL